jgi:hypothetical protein
MKPRLLRPRALMGMLAAGCLTTAACKHDGAYQLSWAFAQEAQPVSELTCAKHGVFSIRISAIAGASIDTVAVPCGPGQVTRAIAAGTWSFEVWALDSDGKYRGDLLPPNLPGAKDALMAKIDATEIAGEQTATLAVQLNPLPQCADGVDNDADGRVDIDDPGCAGKRDGADEATEGTGGP